jgi:hypothetical protein
MEEISLSSPVDEKDLKAILSFIPRLQEIVPDKVVIESPGRLLEQDGNNLVLAMHGEYHPLVEEFLQALYRHKFIRNYDWGKWTPQAEAIYKDQRRLDRATMTTCLKLLTLHARRDRFVEGHFAAMLTSGHIIAVLKRMEELGRGIPPTTSLKEIPVRMKLEYDFYMSEPSLIERYAPRFSNPESVQLCLKVLCKTWVGYLQHYTERAYELFGRSECPWESTERAIVSTLAAAIMRKLPGSIVIEESRVLKPGKERDQSAKKPNDLGRCDLWASVPKLTSDVPYFNFYLEAKKSLRPKNAKGLEEHLLSKYGISKLFRDFMKGHPRRLTQRSAYRNDKERKHEHYIVGLLVTPLAPGVGDFKEMKKILGRVFENSHKLYVRTDEAGADFRNDRRHMARYPTVALILFDPNGGRPGMIASFTVMGSTNSLSASGSAKQKSK